MACILVWIRGCASFSSSIITSSSSDKSLSQGSHLLESQFCCEITVLTFEWGSLPPCILAILHAVTTICPSCCIFFYMRSQVAEHALWTSLSNNKISLVFSSFLLSCNSFSVLILRAYKEGHATAEIACSLFFSTFTFLLLQSVYLGSPLAFSRHPVLTQWPKASHKPSQITPHGRGWPAWDFPHHSRLSPSMTPLPIPVSFSVSWLAQQLLEDGGDRKCPRTEKVSWHQKSRQAAPYNQWIHLL